MIPKAKDLIFNKKELIKFREKCRKESKKVVLASGVFDILHEGHLRFLQTAREFGDVLIVGINDDTFARKKGSNRPIQNENTRAFLIAGFECVNCVYIYDNSDPKKPLVSLVQPDVYLMSNSSSQKPKDRMYQFDIMKKIGGEVIVLGEFSKSHSTTIIEKLEMSNEY